MYTIQPNRKEEKKSKTTRFWQPLHFFFIIIFHSFIHSNFISFFIIIHFFQAFTLLLLLLLLLIVGCFQFIMIFHEKKYRVIFSLLIKLVTNWNWIENHMCVYVWWNTLFLAHNRTETKGFSSMNSISGARGSKNEKKIWMKKIINTFFVCIEKTTATTRDSNHWQQT